MRNALRALAAGGSPGGAPAAGKLPGVVLRVAITALLLWLAFRHANWSMIQAGLVRMRGGWFAAAVALLGLQLAVAAQRWRWIMAGCGLALPAASALRYVFIGQFFSQTLPATIGADGARIWYLGRTSGNWKSAAYSVVIDRSIGGLALGILVVAILPGAFSRIHDPAGQMSLLVVGGACLAAFASVIAIGVFPFWDRWPATRHARVITSISWKLFRNPPSVLRISTSPEPSDFGSHPIPTFCVMPNTFPLGELRRNSSSIGSDPVGPGALVRMRYADSEVSKRSGEGIAESSAICRPIPSACPCSSRRRSSIRCVCRTR